MISINFINSIVNARSLAGLPPVEAMFYVCPRCCGRHAEACDCTHVQEEGFAAQSCRCHRCGYHGPTLEGDEGGTWEPIDTSIVFANHAGRS